MAENIYQAGTTVRLTCTFQDIDGVARDPDSITVNIYDQTQTSIGSYPLASGNRTGVGAYFYDYLIPSNFRQRVYYEFNCVYGGETSLQRNSFRTTFM